MISSFADNRSQAWACFRLTEGVWTWMGNHHPLHPARRCPCWERPDGTFETCRPCDYEHRASRYRDSRDPCDLCIAIPTGADPMVCLQSHLDHPHDGEMLRLRLRGAEREAQQK